jgi:hypothetical protein
MSRVDASTSLSQSYSSFSGVDIRVIINGHECGSIQQLSYMIQREKTPNYVMGSVDPISFGRGKRGINGVIRGLLLDLDLLYSKSFENEKALLDRDELFYSEKIEKIKQTRKTHIAAPLVKDPEPLSGRYTWIYEEYIKPNFFPGVSLKDTAYNCLESAFESALKTLAKSFWLGAAGIARALIQAAVSCAGAGFEGVVYRGGASQLAMDLALMAPTFTYYVAYDEAVERRQLIINNNVIRRRRAKPTVKIEETIVEKRVGQNSNYALNHEYNLDNLGSNYTVSKAEYLDQILPFDITIIAVNEYGQSAQMRLYGCEIMSANSELSIDSMTVPYSLNFTARAILPWRSFDLGDERGKTTPQSNEAKQTAARFDKRASQESEFGGGIKVKDQGSLIDDEEIDIADDLLDEPLDFDEDRDNDGILNENDPNPDIMDDPAVFEQERIEEAEDVQVDELTEDEVERTFQDTDNDGVPNIADPDNDNDGIPDGDDPAPNFGDDSSGFHEAVDTDGDGVPNFDDDDDDNDGVTDPGDAFPLDANESVDNDQDGSGANSDPDDNDPTVIGV